MRTILFLLTICSTVWGQSSSGTIQGRVVDAQEAAIPNARVTVTNRATNVSRTSSTNELGLYVIPFLTPGAYSVTTERDGFKRALRTGVLLQVSDQLTVNVRMEVEAWSSRSQWKGPRRW